MREPWVHFEDDHVLVVHKPAGVNTHRADEHAQDGMHEWVQRQRPLVDLSILHRLDKATSGLLVFGTSAVANRSLAEQFESRTVTKAYELIVEHAAARAARLRCDEPIDVVRRGRAVPLDASTGFERLSRGAAFDLYRARPHTGRTHQVRLHAQALAMPIVGDAEHGGAGAPRLFLHAAALGLDHPAGGALDLVAPHPASFDHLLAGGADIAHEPSLAALVAYEARAALFDLADTNAYLWIDRHHDGFDHVRVERLGTVAVAYNATDPPAPLSRRRIDALAETLELSAIYEQPRPRGGGGGPARLVHGAALPQFEVRELGLAYRIDLDASDTSTGLFLDQRETRRRLLTTDLADRTVLNAFGHTGSLSVAAASAGAHTLTLDLSKRYLEWARDNLRANTIDPADHDFVYGDALEWMERFAKKGRTFDVVIVDPPSSSTSPKRSKGGKATRWVVERDLHTLVTLAARLCAPGGTLFVSTNLHRLRWETFLEQVSTGLTAAGRVGAIETQTVPLDHRSGPGDPPYLKAAWIHLDGDGDLRSARTGGPRRP